MQVSFEYAPWGVFFAGLMYVIGNGVWVNHLVRERNWLGWPLWLAAGVMFLLVAALFESRLDTASSMGMWERLTGVDGENHWIALSLFALLSVPGAASVLFRQSIRWTRLALLLPAVMIFIPMGRQLANPDNNYLLLSLGAAAVVCAAMYVWQMLLDVEPEKIAAAKQESAS